MSVETETLPRRHAQEPRCRPGPSGGCGWRAGRRSWCSCCSACLIAAINPNFLSFGNFVRIAQAAMIPLVLGLGATFIILMGSIDLSVEGVLALGAV